VLNKIRNVFISNSDTTDIIAGFSNAGDLIISDSQFTTNKDCFEYQSLTLNQVKIFNCTFSGSVKIITLIGGIFTDCTFKAGVVFTNPGNATITWDGCNFLGLGSGVGIDVSGGPNFMIQNCIVSNCRFDSLATGITADYNNIIGWKIIGCIFTNIATYGIIHTNSDGVISFNTISRK